MAEPFFLPIFSANLWWEEVFTSIISFTAFPKIISKNSLSLSLTPYYHLLSFVSIPFS
jgi:hypothetical protein